MVLKTIIIEIIKNIDNNHHDNISSSNDNNKNDDNSNVFDENDVKLQMEKCNRPCVSKTKKSKIIKSQNIEGNL